jgi:hypothetical protein
MSQTLIIHPMDPVGRQMRRRRVDALTHMLYQHAAKETWAEPAADLQVKELAREVRGMSGHIRRVLIEIAGERDGQAIHTELFDGQLEQVTIDQIWFLLDQQGVRSLGERALELHKLVKRARAEMDALLQTPNRSTVGHREQLLGDLVDAEHRRDGKLARQLRQQFARESELNPDAWGQAFERARRDQARRVQLGLVPPAPSSLLQRLLTPAGDLQAAPAG